MIWSPATIGRLFAVAAVGACLAPSSAANAATTTATFQATVTVNAACTLSATPLAFGAFSGAPVTATNLLTIDCTVGTPFQVGLDPGLAPGATTSARKLVGPGGAVLLYELYSNPGRTLTWGNALGTDTVSGVGATGNQTFTVYGRIPATLDVGSGNYTDTITATLTF